MSWLKETQRTYGGSLEPCTPQGRQGRSRMENLVGEQGSSWVLLRKSVRSLLSCSLIGSTLEIVDSQKSAKVTILDDRVDEIGDSIRCHAFAQDILLSL